MGVKKTNRTVWAVRIAALSVFWGGDPVLGQDLRDSGILRMFTSGSEIGRERFVRTGEYLETETIIPVLAVKVRTRATYRSGRLAAYRAEVFRLPHDSLLQTYSALVENDSVKITHRAGGGERRWSVAARVDAVAASQSLAAFGDLVHRALGRDTAFSLWSAERNAALEVRVRHFGDSVVLVTDLLDITVRLGPTGRFQSFEIPAQRLKAERAETMNLPPLAGLEPPRADYSAPPGAPYYAEEVRIPVRTSKGESFELAGTLTVPKTGAPPYPAVILITGSGAQDRDENLWPLVPEYRPFRDIADRLSREGFAVVRCDDRGFPPSGGSRDSATMEDFAEDVIAQLAWLRSRPEIDGARVALIGHSEGGVVGPMVAVRDSAVAAVVIMAGSAKPGIEVLRDQLIWPIESAQGLPEERKRELKAKALEQLSSDTAGLSPWMRHFRYYDPLVAARRLRQPVLILHGALDRQVSVGQADTLARAIREGGNRDVTVRIFPRLNHLFLVSPSDGSPAEYATIRDTAVAGEVLEVLSRWLRERLGAQRPD
ncbi:Esterase EstD [bacterium HR33]|nr:Esterase EstD [bacterium HR33]